MQMWRSLLALVSPACLLTPTCDPGVTRACLRSHLFVVQDQKPLTAGPAFVKTNDDSVTPVKVPLGPGDSRPA